MLIAHHVQDQHKLLNSSLHTCLSLAEMVLCAQKGSF